MFSTNGILGRNFAVATAALDGLALRQELHARNLANVDTEGYRAQTVDFESVLGAAVKGDKPGLMWNNPFGASGGPRGAMDGAQLSESFVVTTKGGKPGVDRTTEVAQMASDNVKFRVMTQQVTNQLSAVRSVIAEMGRG